MTWIYVWSLSQTFRRFHQSKWSPYVDPLWLRNVDGTVRLPPITQPNRVFCRYKSVSFDWWIICSPHSDASVDPALNKMSIGPGLWNLGSAGWRFLGIWIIDLRVDLGPMSLFAGVTKNVNVHLYVPSMEVIVVVIWSFAVVFRVSRAPIGIEHLQCFMPSDLTNFSVIKFMVEPVSSRVLHRIGCALWLKMFIWDVTNRSWRTGSDGDVTGE